MRQTPYYVFDTDEFAKRAAMILSLIHISAANLTSAVK